MNDSKKNFKVLTLISAILLVVAGVVLVGASVVLAYLMWLVGFEGDVGRSFIWIFAGGWLISVMVFFLVLAVAISTIVVGAKEVKLVSMDAYSYNKKIVTIIGHLIFDGIMAGLFTAIATISLGVGSDTGFVMFIFSVVIACVYAICFLFVLIDRIVFKNRLKKGILTLNDISANKTNVDFSAINNDKKETKKSEIDNLEESLSSLKNLKEKGLLTDEEYESAKKNAINKHLNK